MTAIKPTADEVISQLSAAIKAPEENVRASLKRTYVDPVAFWKEKRALTSWKKSHDLQTTAAGAFQVDVTERRPRE